MFLLGHFAVFVERTGGNFWIYVVNLRKYLRFEGEKRETTTMTNVCGAKTSHNFQWVDNRHAFTSLPLISFQYTFISYEKFLESCIKFFFLFYFIFQFESMMILLAELLVCTIIVLFLINYCWENKIFERESKGKFILEFSKKCFRYQLWISKCTIFLGGKVARVWNHYQQVVEGELPWQLLENFSPIQFLRELITKLFKNSVLLFNKMASYFLQFILIICC